ncbi:MAG: lysine 2,3-aminomutase [Pseudomonadota bacterium]|nr:lysine 2,3-aminomutase [Pseudomonadota bacterium]
MSSCGFRSSFGAGAAPKYQAYTLKNFRDIPQIQQLSEQQLFDIEVVGHVLPFKTNNFVVDHLINWDAVPNDPMFALTFPQHGMLLPHHYDEIAGLIRAGAQPEVARAAANRIRMELNPHPAGQIYHNTPYLDGEPLHGMQHKYAQTVLFFPSQGQTCHAYCSFCFRWPQFTLMAELRFASREVEGLVAYVRRHPEITDVLFTGGDPLVMSVRNLASYLEPLIEADLPNLRRIRIGTKAFTYWPYRFLGGEEADALIALFRRVVASGKHLAVMAHFNHPRELEPQVVRLALGRVRETGAEIRTQSPLLRHINDDPDNWATLWNELVDLGCVPYYMFVARNTGAQHFFAVPLVRAWEIYRDAYKNVSGLCRTVRGPSMSANPGKIQVLGATEVAGQQVLELRFIQGRNPDWVQRPFFAQYNEAATWINELKPAFGERKFFFEEEFEGFYRENLDTSTAENYE